MKKRRLMVLCLTVMILFSSFGVNAAKYSKKTNELTSSINEKRKKGRKLKSAEVEMLTSSSIELLDQTIKKDGADANVFISPVSIMFAFGLAENGAKGKTRRQIENAVFGGMKISDTNKTLCKLMNNMEADKNVKWNVANSVWMRDRSDIKVRKAFLKSAVADYDAEVFKAEFNAATVKDVNKWVKKNTSNMIPKLVDRFDSDTVLCLLNALSFEASWQECFTDKQLEKDADFTNINGSKSKVTMMNGTVSGYFQLNGANGFKKMYKGGKYAYVAIEMPKGVRPAAYISELSRNPEKFNTSLKDMKYDRNVSIRLPEYEMDYDLELTDVVKKMGVTRAFDRKKANLYYLFKKDGKSNYYFSKVLHKTHIEVDKNGTKAAAATAIVIDKCSSVEEQKEPLTINLDHPFVYAIVDTKTNLPLFIGCVNTLE